MDAILSAFRRTGYSPPFPNQLVCFRPNGNAVVFLSCYDDVSGEELHTVTFELTKVELNKLMEE